MEIFQVHLCVVNMVLRETVIFIDGMTCQSCVNHIQLVLRQKPGVKLVKVSLELKFAFVGYDPSLTSPASLAAVVDDIGFEASLADCKTLSATWITVSGMTCQSCVRHIEGMVGNVIGVRSVVVSLNDSLATVMYDCMQTSASDICSVINDIGFNAYILPGMTFEESVISNPTEVNLRMQASGDEFSKLASSRTNAGQKTCEISVGGMTCSSCVKNIESAVSSISGIISVSVSLDQNKANVVFDPVEILPEIVAEKIDDMGFVAAVLIDVSATDHDQEIMATLGHGQPDKNGKTLQYSANSPHQMTAVLNVTGMHCQSCVKKIEGYLKDMVGVVSVKVTLENELCLVVYEPSCISAEILRQAVESAGDFKASFSGMFVLFCVVLQAQIHIFSCLDQSH